MMLQPLLLILYETQHKQHLSIENGTLVNRWKFALMMFQPLLLFLYQTQHKQYLNAGQLLEICYYYCIRRSITISLDWKHWSIVGRPTHDVERRRLLGKHNITLSRLPSPPTQKGTSNFMIVSFRNTIIMVLVGKQLELLELKAKRHSQGCSISKIGFVYCQRTHVASKLIR